MVSLPELPECFIDNVLSQSGITLSFATANYTIDEIGKLKDKRSLDQWECVSIAAETIHVNTNSIAINSLVIYNHNLSGIPLVWKASNDSGFSSPVTLDSWTQSDSQNILRKIDSVNYSFMRISIASGSESHKIGEIYLGESLQWPRMPDIPIDIDGKTSLDEIFQSSYGVKDSRGRLDLIELDLEFSPMLISEFEIFKTLWQSTRSHIPFFFVLFPDSYPENILLCRANMTKFNSQQNGPLREGLKYPLIEVK